MDFSNIELHESLVLVVPVLLIIGGVLKSTPKFPDWAIAWTMLFLGTLGGIAAIGLTFDGIINGLLAGGIAITSNQVYKQTKKALS